MALQKTKNLILTMPHLAEILKSQFNQSVGLPWQDLLPESRIVELLDAEEIIYRQSVYTPFVTLWCYIAQALDPDKSLRNAVARVIAYSCAAGVKPPSKDTGAYAKARGRFSEEVMAQLIPETADAIEEMVPREEQWLGRRVRVYDGTTILLADTAANQQAYPQHGNQKAGCGFPIAKLVVVFSLVTGAVVNACVGHFRISELVLSRMLYGELEPNDVALADQAYGNYVDLSLVWQQGADGIFRKHYARQTDFRRGKRLSKGDHLVTWFKPKIRPNHMTEEVFAALPEQLEVREVKLRIVRPGYRDQIIYLVTTLLDAKIYTTQKLSELYGMRWQAAEINLRHVKTTLKMEQLTAKTPAMSRKDLWAHLLAYNLLRTMMVQSAQSSGSPLKSLSLQGSRQQFMQVIGMLAVATKKIRKRLYAMVLSTVAEDLLPFRPFRSEPRVVKRRPKPFPRMTRSRSILRALLYQ
jgi:Transposase DDE domain